MGRRKLNLRGAEFGKLVIIERAEESKEGHSQWLCRCECGNTKVIRQASLRAGLTNSCGCEMKTTHLKNFKHDIIHGDHGKPLHNEWMRLRKLGHLEGSAWDENYILFRSEAGHPPFDGAKLRKKHPGVLSGKNKVWTV